MPIGFIVLGILAGMLVPLEAGVNGRLGKALGSPLQAAAVACAAGGLVLVLWCLATTRGLFSLDRAASAPWWSYIGGVLGAGFVAICATAAPKVGALALIASIIAGQMLCSVVLDHFGWTGYSVRPVSAWRIAGLILIAAGVALVVGRTPR